LLREAADEEGSGRSTGQCVSTAGTLVVRGRVSVRRRVSVRHRVSSVAPLQGSARL